MVHRHPAYSTPFPPSEDTVAGRMMLELAAGRDSSLDDLLVDLLEDGEALCPDDPAASELDEAGLRELLGRVEEAYRAAVPRTSEDTIAFATALPALRDQGIALSIGSGFDQGEAAREAHALTAELEEPVGYVYASTQDFDTATETCRLYLGFSDVTGEDRAATVRVGEIVVAELRAHGLSVSWDGTDGERIALDPFVFAVELPEAE